MNEGLVLDGLILLVIALYIPIGALRGGLREALLGGALLLGAALAGTRPKSWGDEAASLTGFGHPTAGFLVAIGCIVGTALVVGIGGGTLCDRRAPSWRGRILGAGFGGVNATLGVAMCLSAYERLALEGDRAAAVSQSHLGRRLIDRFDLVILGVGVVTAVAVVGGHVINRFLGVSYDSDIEPALTWVQATHRPPRSIRMPAEADGGKVEPDSVITSGNRTVSTLRAMRDVPPRQPIRDRAVSDDPGWADLPWREEIIRPVEPPDPSLAELHRLLRIEPRPQAADVEPPRTMNAHPHVFDVPRSTTDVPDQPPSGQLHSDDWTCPRCAATLPDPTLPCPFCDDR